VLLLQNVAFLQEATLFTVCFASTSGDTDDPSWRDSYIRMHMSKITSVSAAGLTHATYGTLARISPLVLTYNGHVENGRWLSIVDGGLNNDAPCTDSRVAAGPSDTLHSGLLQARVNTTVVDIAAASLSDTVTFAVCYCEEITCNATTLWTDTGIRLRISQVKAATHWIKRSTGMPMLSVMGTLSLSTSYLSLVDGSRNNNNPCISQSDVEANAGTHHSGSKALIAGTKDVEMWHIWSMDTSKVYALCYSEDISATNDISWRDTNIRIRLINRDSKVRRVTFLPYSAKPGLSSTSYLI